MPFTRFFVLQELDTEIASLRDELRLAHTLPDENNAHLTARSAAARRDAGAIQATLDAREEERAETARHLPSPWLRRYERLQAQYPSRPWVVWLEGSACPACSDRLPSTLLDTLHGGAPAICPACRRLLLWRDRRSSRPHASRGRR